MLSINSNPELTEKVCVPRAVFIQYPFGRILGEVDDREGQRAVCDDMLDWMERAVVPNSYLHLSYEWPEPPRANKMASRRSPAHCRPSPAGESGR